MKLLVTGGCGYKGSVLIPLLLADGHSVISIDTQWFGNALPEDPQLTNLKLDVRDTDAIPSMAWKPSFIWPTLPMIQR